MAFIFINSDYFQGDLNLSNIATGSIEGAILTQKIDFYKRRYFETLLGYELATAFLDEMEAYDPNNPTLTYQGWLDLAFGTTYVGDDEVVYRWRGFRSHDSPNVSDNDDYISPFANYIFCKHLQQISVVTTSMGAGSANVENMATRSPIDKIVEAWNQMCEWHWHLHNVIMTSIEDYDGYIGEKYPPTLKLGYQITENRNLFLPINSFGI